MLRAAWLIKMRCDFTGSSARRCYGPMTSGLKGVHLMGPGAMQRSYSGRTFTNSLQTKKLAASAAVIIGQPSGLSCVWGAVPARMCGDICLAAQLLCSTAVSTVSRVLLQPVAAVSSGCRRTSIGRRLKSVSSLAGAGSGTGRMLGYRFSTDAVAAAGRSEWRGNAVRSALRQLDWWRLRVGRLSRDFWREKWSSRRVAVQCRGVAGSGLGGGVTSGRYGIGIGGGWGIRVVIVALGVSSHWAATGGREVECATPKKGSK